MLLYYFGQCLCRKIIFFTSQVWSHTTDGICCSCLTYNKRCLVEMVLTICDVLKDTKVECIKPETSQPHIQQFCVLQKCYRKRTGQNRRQKVSNGRALHLSRGAWHWKSDKTPLTYTASHFNLRGLGTSTGGLRPPRPPVATGLEQVQKQYSLFVICNTADDCRNITPFYLDVLAYFMLSQS